MRNTVPEEAGQVLNLSGINSHRQTIFVRDLDRLSITVRIKDGHYVRKHRDEPSSNAVKAQKDLMRRMIDGEP